jgi:F-type H+-transporting ATPase subunit b
MENQMLDISPILLLSSALIFLVVLARLNSCLYKPLMKHIDDRNNSIAKDLESAKNNATDVNGMYEEASNIIALAKKESSSIRESAYNEAKNLSDSKVSEFKAQLENKYSDFVTNLDQETKSLKLSLVNKMPQFKETLSAKLSSI